ncbi:MAG TPA: LytTR family DNA-binding domain-containing protein [Candidatus Omnitrophota bacterium]|nr:LytTR family DNA-binding domain-containing protein [Candidatus Omnitrophota bacterium]
MIRVLIADDEPLAREELEKLISANGDFQVVAQASGGKDALGKLEKEDVEVAFLDIEMPGLNGLEVASRLAEWEDPPLVVFATAYEQYAVQAFEANAIDYILKPYDPARIQKTLAKIRERASRTSEATAGSKEKLVALEDYLIRRGTIKKLVGHRRNSKDRIVIDSAQVFFFYAELAEVLARVLEEDLIVRSTLKDLAEMLDPARFAQTHKAYIVNIDKIAKVAPMFSGNFQIILKDPKQTKIPLSRRYARDLKKLLGNW